MRLLVNTITVELAAHGQFSTSLQTYTSLMNRTHRELAKLIADEYAGTGEESAMPGYWRQWHSSILAVVYGGMIDPKN